MNPSLKASSSTLPLNRHQRSTALGLFLFLACSVLWLITIGLIFCSSPLISLIACLANGVATAMLFVVGHDAGHGTLVPSRTLNRWIGRMALLPGLHPLSTWKKSHNTKHHVWTNLKGEDPGYAPFSLEEFRQLSRARQLAERCYRTPLGLGAFYFKEIYWKYILFPRATDRPRNHSDFRFDRFLVTSFFLAECLTYYLLAAYCEWPWPLLHMTCAIGIPLAIFMWLIGFVTFQHHTHPGIPWFDQHEEWSSFQCQLAGTTHVQFPRAFDGIFLNILEHTAHHVDPLIPLYHLPESQLALETKNPGVVKIVDCSPLSLLNTLRCCKLYDYRAHCWCDFNGTRTSEYHLETPLPVLDRTEDVREENRSEMASMQR